MKLAVLGGAGIRIPLLVKGITGASQPLFDKVTLFDVDEERLWVMSRLAQYLLDQAGSPVQLEVSTDIAESVRGAQYVFSAIRVGQNASRVIDERVALRQGVVGQETTGPGGFAMALRTIPVALEYARVIRAVAPDAWLLNFTNPAGIITQALLDHSEVPAIGICDSPLGIQYRLARYLAVNAEELEMDYVGLNHLGWISDVRHRGESKIKELLHHYEDLSQADAEFGAFDAGLVRQMGLLPNEYLYYYYYSAEAVRNVVSVGETRGEQIVTLAERLYSDLREAVRDGDLSRAWASYQSTMGMRSKTYMQREMNSSTEERGDREEDGPSTGYAGVAMQAVQAMRGEALYPIILNVRNGGAVTGLQRSDVVEVPAVVNASGTHPLAMGELPRKIAGLMLSVKEYERLTVQAAVTGDIQTAIEALTVHPLVPSYRVAKALFEDYRTQLAQWLPQF